MKSSFLRLRYHQTGKFKKECIDFVIPYFRSSLSYTGLQMPMSFMDLGIHTNNG